MRGTPGPEPDRYAGFRAFVEARSSALLRTAYLLTGDAHLAEDLVQVALTRTAERWPHIRDGHPEAYARRVLYTEHVSWWRRRRHATVVPVAELPEPESGRRFEDGVTLRMALERALDTLAPRQRAVLVLRFFDDCTEAQAADVLGCSVGTVKSQTHDALRRLRQAAPELAELLGEAHPTTREVAR